MSGIPSLTPVTQHPSHESYGATAHSSLASCIPQSVGAHGVTVGCISYAEPLTARCRFPSASAQSLSTSPGLVTRTGKLLNRPSLLPVRPCTRGPSADMQSTTASAESEVLWLGRTDFQGDDVIICSALQALAHVGQVHACSQEIHAVLATIARPLLTGH